MFDIHYECNETGVIHGHVSNGLHTLRFLVRPEDIMDDTDLFSKFVIALLKQLEDESRKGV